MLFNNQLLFQQKGSFEVRTREFKGLEVALSGLETSRAISISNEVPEVIFHRVLQKLLQKYVRKAQFAVRTEPPCGWFKSDQSSFTL